MALHQIFVVHGMGNFKEGWSTDIQNVIKESYATYESASFAPFDNLFEFQEVTYNDLFEERREAWKNKAGEINLLLTANGFTDHAAQKLMKLANATTGDDFFRTHILDVIMYRFMPQIAEQIRRAIQLTILERLSEFPENEAIEWSIVAHSLGTSVIHDTLHAVFTHQVAGNQLSRILRPQVLCMVANVSRVLWNDIDFYGTAVRPSPLPSEGVCNHYINAHHELDPFPRVKPFHKPADQWLSDNAVAAGSYKNVKVPKEELTDWNVHGFAHYLRNPRVHVPLYRALLFDKFIKNPEFKTSRDQYAKGLLKKSVRNKIMRELEKVNPGALDDWEEITDVITKFRQLVLNNTTSSDEGEE
jgi:hypothetical protein